MAPLVPRLAHTAALIFAFPAHADNVHSWGPQFFASTITMQPTDEPGAVAEIIFDNKTVHADETVTFTLDLDGLAVEVTAIVGRGLTPDYMAVTPPEGYIAMPPDIDVEEDQSGRILVVPFLGY